MECYAWEMFLSLILVTLCTKGKADFTCFSSSSSEAKDITLIYDKHHDTRNLWERNTLELAPCDFSSIFSSKCSVCLNDSARPETVLLVLWNLTGSEELRMEGVNGKLFFNQIGTTEPVTKQKSGFSTPGGSESNNQRGRIGLYIFLGCFIPLLLFLIWLAQKRHKSQKTPADGSSSISSDPESGSELINTPRDGPGV
ncbi:uncharacterized protein LOC106943583 isoform X2 [Poecilia latipinna]|uniref:uncharacterized protein LOC106943583 isoform X2 n=1 Tax=Poecilia latipinna TaxID=48699 RepID=UPI00072E2E2E|nr:PREDICTED: uncharacterized protein LOC106943583 isoform X2 [Poecilia latipinna]